MLFLYLVAIMPPVISIALHRFVFMDKFSIKALAWANFVIFYTACIAYAIAVDYWIEMDLNSYDLDGDGIFSEAEQTPGQKEAMFRYISDLGRKLLPIFGLVYGLAHTACFAAVLFAGSRALRLFRGS